MILNLKKIFLILFLREDIEFVLKIYLLKNINNITKKYFTLSLFFIISVKHIKKEFKNQ